VNSSTITATTPAHTAGTVDVVVATPGGTGTGTNLFTYVVAPTVTSINPTSGLIAGGTLVTISGSNFLGATSVTIGGTAATGISVVNGTTITATIPAHTVGTVDVVVVTPGGAGTGTGLFNYYASPTATTGSASDVTGTTATLNGTVNPQNASTTVKFQWGPTNALGSEYAFSGSSTGMSDTTFNYPLSGLLPLTTYYYRIVATNAGGTTNGDTLTFTTSHMSSVVILNVTPSSGPVGTVITLTGSGFTNATSVIIGMETMFTVVSDTEITCVIPPGATTGPVTVTSPAGTGTSATSITVEQEG